MNKNPFYEFFKGYIPKFIMIIFIAITVISQLIFSNHWEGNRENY